MRQPSLQVDHEDKENKALLAFNELWVSKFAHDSLLVFSTGRSHALYTQLKVSYCSQYRRNWRSISTERKGMMQLALHCRQRYLWATLMCLCAPSALKSSSRLRPVDNRNQIRNGRSCWIKAGTGRLLWIQLHCSQASLYRLVSSFHIIALFICLSATLAVILSDCYASSHLEGEE